MVTRDFDAMLAEAARQRPTFTVAGQVFTLRAKLPHHRWNKLLAAMRAENADERETTEKFFRTVLIKADRERFLELLYPPQADDDDDDDANDDFQIDMSQVDAITDFAMEHFTGKLRSSTGSSSAGVNGTGRQQSPASSTLVKL